MATRTELWFIAVATCRDSECLCAIGDCGLLAPQCANRAEVALLAVLDVLTQRLGNDHDATTAFQDLLLEHLALRS